MRSIPESVTAVCAHFPRPGGGPLYRVVWSEDRLEHFFGVEQRIYGDDRNRWMLEKWAMPVESPEEWAAVLEEALGPFPRQGVWEHSFTFEAPVDSAGDGNAVMVGFEPPPDLVHSICTAIERGKLNHTAAERKAAKERQLEAIERERKQRFNDLWDDAAPAPGARIPEHIQMLDSLPQRHTVTTANLPQGLPKRGFKQLSPNTVEETI